MLSLMAPLSHLYSGLVGTRNMLFERNLLKTVDCGIPVVSVGNLTLGGTGKTPIVGQLLVRAKQLGVSVSVVSRGYGGKYKKVQRVRGELSEAPYIYGDEPTLLARQHPGVPIVVGKKRVEAAEFAVNEGCDLIIADDAFQHRYLKRSLDIVLIDATVPVENYEVLPRGRGREGVEALRRANFVVVTRSNLVDQEILKTRLQWLEEKSGAVDLFQEEKIAFCEYHVGSPVNHAGEKAEWHNFIAVSGIANPESFVATLEKCGIRVVDDLKFKDHRSFSAGDISQMVQRLELYKDVGLVCTEKDYVKLASFHGIKNRLSVAPLMVKFTKGEERLYEKVFALSS